MEHEIESDNSEALYMDTIRLEESQFDLGTYLILQGSDEISLTKKQLMALKLILNVEFSCNH